MLKVTKALDWHVEGEVVERDIKAMEVPEGYVEDMKTNLVKEADELKAKKEKKIRELKMKRKEEKPLKEEESKKDQKL